MTTPYTSMTIPCAMLDQQARLPSDEQIGRAPDEWDMYLMLARKAQIHLEIRMEMARQEEEQQEQRR